MQQGRRCVSSGFGLLYGRVRESNVTSRALSHPHPTDVKRRQRGDDIRESRLPPASTGEAEKLESRPTSPETY